MTKEMLIVSAAAAAVRYFIEDGRFRVGLVHPAWRDVRGKDADRILAALRGRVFTSKYALLKLYSREDDENILRIWINTFDAADNNPDGKAICNGADLIPDQKDPHKYKPELTAAVFHDVGLGGGRAEALAEFTGLPPKEVKKFWNALYAAEVRGIKGRVSRGFLDTFVSPWLWIKRKFFVFFTVCVLALAGCAGCTALYDYPEIVDGSDVIIDAGEHGIITNKFNRIGE